MFSEQGDKKCSLSKQQEASNYTAFQEIQFWRIFVIDKISNSLCELSDFEANTVNIATCFSSHLPFKKKD